MTRIIPCEWCPKVATLSLSWYPDGPDNHSSAVFVCDDHAATWTLEVESHGVPIRTTRMNPSPVTPAEWFRGRAESDRGAEPGDSGPIGVVEVPEKRGDWSLEKAADKSLAGRLSHGYGENPPSQRHVDDETAAGMHVDQVAGTVTFQSDDGQQVTVNRGWLAWAYEQLKHPATSPAPASPS